MPVVPPITIQNVVKMSLKNNDVEMFSYFLDPNIFKGKCINPQITKLVEDIKAGLVGTSVLATNLKYGIASVVPITFNGMINKLIRERNMKFIHLVIANGKKYNLPLDVAEIERYIVGDIARYMPYKYENGVAVVAENRPRERILGTGLRMPHQNKLRLAQTFRSGNARYNVPREVAFRNVQSRIEKDQALPGVVEAIREFSGAPKLGVKFPVQYGPHRPAHLSSAAPKDVPAAALEPLENMYKINNTLFATAAPGAANARKTRRRRN